MKFGDTARDDIVNLYLSGTKIQIIANEFDTDASRIYYILKKRNIKPNRHRKYFPNQKFLYSETEESAYFFGFILGDGSIKHDSKSGTYGVIIKLNQKDKYILEYFCNLLKIPSTAIKQYQSQVCLQIQDKNLITSGDLHKYGLLPNKTYKPIIPTIKQHLKPFLVGLIDADGSIRFGNKYSFNIVNNHLIIDWFETTVKSLGFQHEFTRRVYKHHISLNLYKINEIVDLAKLLKPSAIPFCLLRKWGPIINFLKAPYQLKKDNSNAAKLSINQVKEIKSLLKAGKTQTELAKIYQVTQTSIHHIAHNKTWTNVIN